MISISKIRLQCPSIICSHLSHSIFLGEKYINVNVQDSRMTNQNKKIKILGKDDHNKKIAGLIPGRRFCHQKAANVIVVIKMLS